MSEHAPEPFVLTPELAMAFIYGLRGAGHDPHIDRTGRFGITLNVRPRTIPEPVHPLPDRVFILGFDTRPFDRMQEDHDYIAKLIAAVREAEDFSAHVAGTDK